MSVATDAYHVSRALEFVQKNDLWVSFGKTSAWVPADGDPENPNDPAPPGITSDTNPPIPDLSLVDLDEIVCYKKVSTKQLVNPDTSLAAVLTFAGNTYLPIPTPRNFSALTVEFTSGTQDFTTDVSTGMVIGRSVKIGKNFSSKITAINGLDITIEDAAPETFAIGVVIEAGPVADNARWLYIDTELNTSDIDETTFPEYRQVALWSNLELEGGVPPGSIFLLPNQVKVRPVLELFQNRIPFPRANNTFDLAKIVIEF